MRPPFGWIAAAFVLAAASSDSPPRAASAAAPRRQSPIDIRTAGLVVEGERALPPIEFRYAHHARLDVENTGSPSDLATVEATVAAGDGELRLDGRAYRLVQFHWHTPSEHEVNGERFPMELHLVHVAEDGSKLVTAVFVRAGAEHAELPALFRALPRGRGEHATVADLDLAALLPEGRWSARYTGSLTTPPYTEGVRWLVLAPPIELSPEEIAAFGALFPEGNARGVQALNGRTVVTDDAHFARDEGVAAVPAGVGRVRKDVP
jgi:carbonic anhydrase